MLVALSSARATPPKDQDAKPLSSGLVKLSPSTKLGRNFAFRKSAYKSMEFTDFLVRKEW
jgi:hypothetical protein